MIDYEIGFDYGWLVLGFMNLSVVGAVAGAVAARCLRQRRLELWYRERLARWTHQAFRAAGGPPAVSG